MNYLKLMKYHDDIVHYPKIEKTLSYIKENPILNLTFGQEFSNF